MRNIQVKNKDNIEPCPECGNQLDFNIYSIRSGPDTCEVYAECAKCGFTHDNGFDRYESVMGGTSGSNCNAAMHCWNEACREREDYEEHKEDLSPFDQIRNELVKFKHVKDRDPEYIILSPETRNKVLRNVQGRFQYNTRGPEDPDTLLGYKVALVSGVEGGYIEIV